MALLRLVGGKAEVMRLQSVLFLFAKRQEAPAYEFIPDVEGASSLTAEADLSLLARKGLLEVKGERVVLTDETDHLPELQPQDKAVLCETVERVRRLSMDELLREVFTLSPYHASRSRYASRLLSASEMKAVRAALTPSAKTALYTIGYEGIALEEYLNRLIRHDVKALVDIRNHPVSMKYGFSRATLRRFLERIGVDYIHIPEVGIKPEDRQDLETMEDYHRLFKLYRKKYLPALAPELEHLLELLKEYKRICLGCVEDDTRRCHRTLLAEALTRMPGFVYEVHHI